MLACDVSKTKEPVVTSTPGVTFTDVAFAAIIATPLTLSNRSLPLERTPYPDLLLAVPRSAAPDVASPRTPVPVVETPTTPRALLSWVAWPKTPVLPRAGGSVPSAAELKPMSPVLLPWDQADTPGLSTALVAAPTPVPVVLRPRTP